MSSVAKLKKLNSEEFKDFFEIMKMSFPSIERRTYEDQFSLFDGFSSAAMAEPEAVQPVSVSPAEEAPLPEEEDGPVSNSVSEFADAVDAFLANFSIADGELVSRTHEDSSPVEEAPVAVPAEPVEEAGLPAPAMEPEAPVEAEAQVEPADGETPVPATRRKARVFPLILYILCAIPLGLLGIAALLVPTLLSLALAICLVSGGVLVLTAAFGGFAIFADLMVILGLAILLLALGLLLTWLFIWFIGGAIVGLIRGLCHLGGKWCYKEVPVQ